MEHSAKAPLTTCRADVRIKQVGMKHTGGAGNVRSLQMGFNQAPEGRS